MTERPLLTLDFDGVICRPILGQNIGISRRFLDPDAEAARARLIPRWLGDPFDYVRFNFRRPMPGAREALGRLSTARRLIVVTGRRSLPSGWIRRHGLDGLFDGIVVNTTSHRSPHFKLEALSALGAREHVEDDPRTAQLLAERGIHVYLCAWPRNEGLSYHPLVEPVADLRALAERLAT